MTRDNEMGMTVIKAQLDLNRRFTYRPDAGEDWQILRDPGAVQGDCEDYALTLIWLAEGRSIIRFWLALLCFRYVLWYARTPSGQGHVLLWRWGYGWTDNIQRQAVINRKALRDQGYEIFLPYPVPVIALKFLLRPILRRFL